MNKLRSQISIILFILLSISCTKSDDPSAKVFDLDYMAHIYPDNFVGKITHPFLPLAAGSVFTYSAETAQGMERTEVVILPDTRIVMGITCTIVWDRVYLNNEIIEDTYDWYAQDKDGNVWYFGEDVDNYSNGVIANHYGSWEAGVDGAEPGIMMLGNTVTGLKYRQERYLGQAEDEGEVVSKNENVTVTAGTFTGCIKIRETNPLDPNFLEFKYYAKGVGLLKVEKVDAPMEIDQLISYTIK